MHKLAVIGNPIEHSLSPIVFEQFAQQFNLDINYEKILAKDIDNFNTIVNDFFYNHGLALNITSPYKHNAYLNAKNKTARANFCKTGNFMYLNNDREITVDTTDGIGLVTDIEENNKQKLADKKILLIGSGFVIDSILLDIIVRNPSSIAILARNHERVKFLQNKFSIDLHNVGTKYDIIINSSPNIIENDLFNKISIINDNAFCYDLAYSKVATLFLQLMRKINPNIIIQNGLGMLVEQAKVAFIQLFNKNPNSKEVIDKIRNHNA
ncbi:MAG: hypothetical protein ACK5Z5_02535 [Neisseriaceae bacterium]